MTVYAVFKVGVYRHECAGVFSTPEGAKTVTDYCASLGDGHHWFEVVPFEIDALPVLTENPETYGEADRITEPPRYLRGPVYRRKTVHVRRNQDVARSNRLFVVRGTGQEFDDAAEDFIGTVQSGQFVWHVFEVRE